MANPVEWLRELIGSAIRSKVAGPDATAREQRIWGADGERWHAPSDAIWKVNRDAAMYAGGIRALLLQALHPAAMAGVAGHSGYRSDPWGRLQRTGEFIAMTTYGPIPAAEELVARIRAVHERVRGKTDDGTPYRASDPHLLAWVHAAETQSFLAAYQHFGATRLTAAEADQYVASAAPVGEMLGAVGLPGVLRHEGQRVVCIHKVIPLDRAVRPVALRVHAPLRHCPIQPFLLTPRWW